MAPQPETLPSMHFGLQQFIDSPVALAIAENRCWNEV